MYKEVYKMKSLCLDHDGETTFLERLGIYFLVFIMISGTFEIGLLIYAYVNADKVECNLLWCSFITERTSSKSYMETSSECYVNGNKINCSEFPTQDYEHFYNNGVYEMNGVKPIQDYLNEVKNKT